MSRLGRSVLATEGLGPPRLSELSRTLGARLALVGAVGHPLMICAVPGDCGGDLRGVVAGALGLTASDVRLMTLESGLYEMTELLRGLPLEAVLVRANPEAWDLPGVVSPSTWYEQMLSELARIRGLTDAHLEDEVAREAALARACTLGLSEDFCADLVVAYAARVARLVRGPGDSRRALSVAAVALEEAEREHRHAPTVASALRRRVASARLGWVVKRHAQLARLGTDGYYLGTPVPGEDPAPGSVVCLRCGHADVTPDDWHPCTTDPLDVTGSRHDLLLSPVPPDQVLGCTCGWYPIDEGFARDAKDQFARHAAAVRAATRATVTQEGRESFRHGATQLDDLAADRSASVTGYRDLDDRAKSAVDQVRVARVRLATMRVGADGEPALIDPLRPVLLSFCDFVLGNRQRAKDVASARKSLLAGVDLLTTKGSATSVPRGLLMLGDAAIDLLTRLEVWAREQVFDDDQDPALDTPAQALLRAYGRWLALEDSGGRSVR